jgi:uncharacterized membrane protein
MASTTMSKDDVRSQRRGQRFLKWRVFYPQPKPMEHGRAFWLAMIVVGALAVAFSVFFIVYLTGRQDAYLSHAEDLGIMDQAIWSTLHGQLFHQTICNTIGDTNCVSLAGISRFAIHFEPILFVMSLLYVVFPSPKTLIVVQTIVVASGAFPAFWLARLRLRSNWAGVVVALLYLAYPAQQQATIYDFHAVTFTAALLMFMLYFLYTRRTAWMLVFALLAMMCKEEIPGIVALCGVWCILLQGRWRSGLVLIVMALGWLGMAVFIMHHASPTGAPLLASRYTDLGASPVDIVRNVLLHPKTALKQHVLDHDHSFYLRALFSPVGYIALLAPWVWFLALPTLALNLFSSNVQMYSGLFQYSAEIVPILIFATIEAIVLILYVVRQLTTRVVTVRGDGTTNQRTEAFASGRKVRWNVSSAAYWGVLAVLLIGLLVSMYHEDMLQGALPITQRFSWPTTSAHTELAQTFERQIPPDASVSAQSALVPHISERKSIYLFPYGDSSAQYIFLDVTSDKYPFYTSLDYIRAVKKVLLSGHYGVVDARDGYLLLKQGLPKPALSASSAVKPGKYTDPALVLPSLPTPFCSFVDTSASAIQNPVDAVFSSKTGGPAGLQLAGYSVNTPSVVSISAGYVSLNTYWRVQQPITQPLQIVMMVVDAAGKEHFISDDMPALYWCQTNQWQAGTVIGVTSGVFALSNMGLAPGPVKFAVALVPLTQPATKLMSVKARVPVRMVQGAGKVATTKTNVLELSPLTLTP